MITQAHTPTPWTYLGYADHCTVGRKYHEIIDADDFEVANQTGILTGANAHLIVKAVNCHKDLLAALTELEQAVDAINGERGDGSRLCLICHAVSYDAKAGIKHLPNCEILVARTAIAKAEGKE